MSDGPKLVETIHAISLQDIPNCLRRLADAIENGQYGDIPSCVVVLPQQAQEDWPYLFGYGNQDGPYNIVQTLEMAKVNYLTNVMVRRS